MAPGLPANPLGRLGVALLAAALGGLAGSPAALADTPPHERDKRVVFVHGFERGGKNKCDNTWGDMLDAFRQLGWVDTLVISRYYADDTACAHSGTRDPLANVIISSYGDHGKVQSSGHVRRGRGGGRRIVGHSTDARIRHLAHHWAWMVHDRYTKDGHPVDAVGHSMGGLIIRSALANVEDGARGFPRALEVEDVATLGTPHDGVGGAAAFLCSRTHTQCKDLRHRSPFLKDLNDNGQNPQGTGGTEWSQIGAVDDGTVKHESATNMNGPDKVVYAGGQGIAHGKYMHMKVGVDLFDADAEADVFHHGQFCEQFPMLPWPVYLTDIMLWQPVNDDCGGAAQ